MGLGGYLTWTALAREIYEMHGVKVIPVEVHGSLTKLIKSPVFYNNPHFLQDFSGELGIQIQLNNPKTNYCEIDTPQRAIHKSNKHIIETICEPYGFSKPVLKCELNLDSREKQEVSALLKDIPDEFITIEPHSNFEYTVNRYYPFEKWQAVIDEISKNIAVVQIGPSTEKILNNAINLTGKTTFRTAGGIIEKSKFLLSSEGGLTHLATAFNTPAIVMLTGYQTKKMVAYPQNKYIDISSHGPCGFKVQCPDCAADAENYDHTKLIRYIQSLLEETC